jgi:hypothetical protein
MSDQLFSLSAGQNASAPSGPWDVVLRVRPSLDIDVCALLVGEDGKVAGDDDFVFYNAHCHASGAVTLTTESSSAGLRIDPAVVPVGVARIVIAVTVEDKGLLTGLSVRLRGVGAGPVLSEQCLRPVDDRGGSYPPDHLQALKQDRRANAGREGMTRAHRSSWSRRPG